MSATVGRQLESQAAPWPRPAQARLRERFLAVPSSVAQGRRAVVRFAASAGVSDEQFHDIALAASEALTNVVRYAYPDSGGVVDVDAWVAGDELWLLVADDGCGLQAGRASLGLGHGLALIARVADGLAIVDRAAGGTEVQMRFDLRRDGD